MRTAPKLSPQDNVVYAILGFLMDRENHEYNIRKHSKGLANLTQVAGILLEMVAVGWIEATETRADPELNGLPQQYYRITPSGRREFQAETRRRELLHGGQLPWLREEPT